MARQFADRYLILQLRHSDVLVVLSGSVGLVRRHLNSGKNVILAFTSGLLLENVYTYTLVSRKLQILMGGALYTSKWIGMNTMRSQMEPETPTQVSDTASTQISG